VISEKKNIIPLIALFSGKRKVISDELSGASGQLPTRADALQPHARTIPDSFHTLRLRG
jgi:hypothetical protein